MSVCKQWKIWVLLKDEYIFWKKKQKKNEILMWHFHKSCDCLNPQNAWKLGVASVTRTS